MTEIVVYNANEFLIVFQTIYAQKHFEEKKKVKTIKEIAFEIEI